MSDNREVRNATNLGGYSGLDLRGDGGYVVAPPSNHVRGGEYRWGDGNEPDQAQIAPLPTWLLELPDGDRQSENRRIANRYGRIPEGSRNETLARLAGSMRHRGMGVEAMEAALLAENACRCDPPLPDAEVRGIAQSISRYPPGYGDSGNSATRDEHLTDLGNAHRLVRLHGGDLRYCHALKVWFVWDGRRWCRDETDEVIRRAKATVPTIYAEAAHAADQEARETIAKWAVRSEARMFIKNMITLAESEPGIHVLSQSLDADLWALNVLNGTIDLRTGILRPHRRDDLITKLAPVEYDPDARSELLDRFLRRALPDAGTRRFAQKGAGYSLLGETGEDKIIIVRGPTRTGKGTFQDAVAAALGDYAMTAGLGDFEQRDRARGPQPEIVRLRGARLVSVYETSRRLKLSASLLKSVAGSDPITVRDLYAKPITFLPQFTLWIATNHRPSIPDDDDALWERICELPFRASIPPEERDPAVRAELRDPKASGAAVLAWAVEGCLAYQAEGLEAPEIVQQATQEYREEMDPLREFISDCCVLGERCWVSSAALRKEYESWCKEAGEKLLVGRNFTDRLRARGCKPRGKTNARGWSGIGLKSSRKNDT
ncbi:MAG: primase C-terminal domain-containing protein [Myxococcales bacterium]|nr:primase C-terminal domain-containing protein [Myxococcales bacterium]